MLYRFALPLALFAATPVFAQTAPTPEPAAQAPVAGPARHGMGERLQKIHDRLAITPAQQPQWDAVVAALRDNATALRASPAARSLRGGQSNAVVALRAAADLAHARADALQRVIPPVEALYASMTPDQQRAADETLARALHAGRGRHG